MVPPSKGAESAVWRWALWGMWPVGSGTSTQGWPLAARALSRAERLVAVYFYVHCRKYGKNFTQRLLTLNVSILLLWARYGLARQEQGGRCSRGD